MRLNPRFRYLRLVSVDDLRELGAAVRIDQIPDDEREMLLAAIVPAKPLPKERARIGTYASLLALASKLKALPTESSLFDAVCSLDRFGKPFSTRWPMAGRHTACETPSR